MDAMDEEIEIVPPTFLDELLEDEDGERLVPDEVHLNVDANRKQEVDELDHTNHLYEMDTDQPTDTSQDPEYSNSDHEIITEEQHKIMETTDSNNSTDIIPKPEPDKENPHQTSEINPSATTDSDDDLPLSQIVKSNESLTSETIEADPASPTASSTQLDVPDSSSISNSQTNSSGPSEPQSTSSTQLRSNEKPLTPYAYFFNDRQRSIRQANPLATYEQVSNIVQNMWKNLDNPIKQEYSDKANAAAGITVNRVNTAENKGDSPTAVQAEVNEDAAIKSPVKKSPTRKPPARRRAPVRKATLPRACKNQSVPEICLRGGCEKEAVHNFQWAHNYCSSICVVQHCKDEFQKWISTQE